MKKVINCILVILIIFLSISNVYAACTTEENNKIRSEANKVNASYELLTGVAEPGTYTPPDGADPDNYELTYSYYKVYIDNLTENLYVTVYNSNTKETKKYEYKDSENGRVSFNYGNLMEIGKFTIAVYSSSKTNCEGNKLYSKNIVLPRYNEYSTLADCEGAEDFYLCHEYSTVEQVSYNDFIEKVRKYKQNLAQEELEQTKEKTEQKNKKKYYLIGGISAIVIAIGIGASIVIVRKRRSNNESKKL